MESEFVSKDEYDKVCVKLEEALASEDKLRVDKLEMEAFLVTTSEQHIAACEENEKRREKIAAQEEELQRSKAVTKAQEEELEALRSAVQYFMDRLIPAVPACWTCSRANRRR